MKYEIKNKSDLVADIIIKVDAKEWQSAITKVYEQQKNKYEIQGWRKGKVPQKVIEQNYGNTVFWEDAITELANEGFRKAISENKSFDPIGSPNLSVDKVSDNGAELTITTDVIPPVKLAKYKGKTRLQRMATLLSLTLLALLTVFLLRAERQKITNLNLAPRVL